MVTSPRPDRRSYVRDVRIALDALARQQLPAAEEAEDAPVRREVEHLGDAAFTCAIGGTRHRSTTSNVAGSRRAIRGDASLGE